MGYSNKTHVILIKDENGVWNVRTQDVWLVKEDEQSKTCFVYFKRDFESGDKKGKLYQYSEGNVVVLKKPKIFNPAEYYVYHLGVRQENVYIICHFNDTVHNYWTVAFQDSRPDIVCKDDEIRVVNSASPAIKSKDVLKYLTQMAYLHHYDIRFGDEKKVLLGEQYEHLRRGNMAPLLEAFLVPNGFKNTKDKVCDVPIYPFCSNSSQMDAVNQALSNRVSVIQGPPGTGKTETILNILMNLVVNGKTAMVVAGSNSATDNILDKLKVVGLDFLVARLGRKSNKESFVKKQLTDNLCPDEWFNETFDADGALERIKGLSNELKELYKKDVKLHQAIEKGNKSEEKDLRLELEESDYSGKCKQLKDLSLAYVKQLVHARYGGDYTKSCYSFDDLGEESTRYEEFLNDYPIVLSTAYSATKCMAVSSIADYIIMDEASQIDLSTGLLALSVAKNAVIVGDDKQLPNVIKKEMADVSQVIFRFFDIDDRFNYATHNILQAVCQTNLGAPETLLREHYRCHPKIARFFNEEFYNGELVCMREDNGEENVLILRQTVPGNHAADFTNNREEEEMEDVISDYDIPEDEYLVGIIAPYVNQVKRIKDDKDIDKDFQVLTTHKFQGRQRDTIIISTVDNRYSDFINDPHLLNVAVSRAKNQLILVTNGNEGNKGNLKKLVDYFKANGICERGEVTSLFDLIYPQYTVRLEGYLNSSPAIPSYFYAPDDLPSAAEQVAYRFISKVLQDYPDLSVKYECPLRLLVKDKSLFNEEELKFISDKRSHVDFLIVNKETSEPVLAIEIDGESYHVEGSFHWQNNKLKDSIMEKCGVPLKRFRTKESINEEETLRELLYSNSLRKLNGKNSEEIANIYNPKLREGSIGEHITKGGSLKLIDASSFLSDDGYMEIESSIKRYIKTNHIIEELKPIYESLGSKYHYEQIKYAIYIFAKKVQYSNGMVKLHPFIDGWLQHQGAYYENDPATVQDGTRLDEKGVKWYLGSIFPKSFAESYSIYYDLLSNTKYNEKLSISTSIKILDIGGGTGGNVAGIILAIISKLPNIQEISIDAYDPCVESRKAYINLINYIDKILKYSGYIHINLECNHLMLQPKFDGLQNGSYTFSNFSTHLAESKKSYDLIMSFKMINELINNGGFRNETPYFNFLKYLCPRLNENGVLILEDVSGDNGEYYCKQLNKETQSYLASQNNFKVLAPIPCAIKQQACQCQYQYINCFMQQQVKAAWETCQYAHMTSRFSYKIMSSTNTCQDIAPTQFNYKYKKVYMNNANNDNNNDHWCYPKDVDMNLPEKDAFKIGDLDYGRENNNN